MTFRTIPIFLAAICACRGAGVIHTRSSSPTYGHDACASLAAGTEKEASRWSVLAYTTGTLGIGAGVVGTVIGEDEDADANWAQKHRNILVAATGAALLYTARSLFKSSDASTAAAGAATRQLATSTADQDAAYKACVEIRATWLEARKDSNTILNQELDAQKKAIEVLEAKLKNGSNNSSAIKNPNDPKDAKEIENVDE